MVGYISVTSLFSFTLSSRQSWDFYVTGVLCEGEKKVAWFVRLGLGARLESSCPVVPPLEQLANAATGEKEGCFLIPACTGLTCL